MNVALPADHPLASKRSLSLTDLRDEQWVQTSADSPCARHVVRSCLAAGFEPAVSFESDDYETIQGLVAAGVGVALIPRLALTRVHAGIVVRALAPRSPARKVTAATMAGAGRGPGGQVDDLGPAGGGPALHRRRAGRRLSHADEPSAVASSLGLVADHQRADQAFDGASEDPDRARVGGQVVGGPGAAPVQVLQLPRALQQVQIIGLTDQGPPEPAWRLVRRPGPWP